MEEEEYPTTDKQKAIVTAALELFSEKGYATTSTKEIALKAGVAEETILNQYSSNKDLLLWICKRIIGTILFPILSGGVPELITEPYGTREEFLAAFFKNRMEQMQEVRPLLKIVLQEAPFQPEIRSMLIEHIQKMPLSRVTEKILAGEKPEFSNADVSQILLTCIMGFFFMHDILLPEFFPEDRKEEDMAALIQFINRGLNEVP